jgi:hypothetical protein
MSNIAYSYNSINVEPQTLDTVACILDPKLKRRHYLWIAEAALEKLIQSYDYMLLFNVPCSVVIE